MTVCSSVTPTLQKLLKQVFKEVKNHSHSWPFAEPVNTEEVTDYLTVIKDPIDLQMIERRLKQSALFYKTKAIFQADLVRMCDNCRTFNEPGSVWFNCADKLQEFVSQKLDSLPV
jgi:histone acetyltransferase